MSGGDRVAVQVLPRRHAMVSYANPHPLPVVAEVCQSFCLDNGAFSSWKSGKQYDPEGFAEWVDQWHLHPGFDFYVMPDVIDGGAEENLKMMGRWLNLVNQKVWSKGVPVWHLHEPLEVLRDHCHAHQRVALGSSGEYADPGSRRWWGRIYEAFEFICDEEGYPPAKLHGLRMLDPTIFSNLPLASADSTNVARNIGIDSRWKGTYAPVSRETRAQILMERIEVHASASKWTKTIGKNHELFG